MKHRSLRNSFLLLPLFLIAWAVLATPSLRITFLDVGQGDSILIRTPEKTILIDAGDDRLDAANAAIIPYFKKEGIKKLDCAVISHPHRDHFGGYVQLVNEIPIDEFLYSTDSIGTGDPEEGSSDAQLYAKLRTDILAKGIKYTKVKMGAKLDWGTGIDVEVLHADDKSSLPSSIQASYMAATRVNRTATDALKISANEQSLIIKVKIGKISYLFTGDAERGAETAAIEAFREKLNCTVLKSGHHGSKTSSGNSFLDLVKPEYGIITVGAKNSFGHPNKETLEKYAFYKMKVFRTDQDGTIDSYSDGGTVHFVSNQSPLEFVEKPEIISLTPNSVTFKWTTNKLSDTKIYYGPADGELSYSKLIDNAATIHTVTLTGLKPESAYKFRAMSQDARITDQVISFDGSWTTPAGNGLPLPCIESFTTSEKQIFVRKSFKTNIKVVNPSGTDFNNLKLMLYHTSIASDNLLAQAGVAKLKADVAKSVDFQIEITWAGKIELLAVLLKDDTIIDTKSISLNVQPKLIYVDCAHGNIDYYTGRFGGMKMDLYNFQGFQLRSASKPLVSIDDLADAFVFVIPEPSKIFTEQELSVLKAYVAKGGALMLYSKSDYGNKSMPEIPNAVLEAVGSKIRFNDDQFCDPTDNIGPPWRAWIRRFPSSILSGVSNILVRNCCSLIAKGNAGLVAGGGVEILAIGDDDSFNQNADNLDDGYIYASHTPLLPIPIAAAEDLGTGRVACFGENLYDDSQYQPNQQIHTPIMNRCVVKWLAASREKTLRQLLQSVESLSGEFDPELRALRFEALNDRVNSMLRKSIENGNLSEIHNTFAEFNSPIVQEIKRNVDSQIEFKKIHDIERPLN